VAPDAIYDERYAWTAVYVVRVELRARGRQPFVLASRPLHETREQYTRGLDVLDMLVEPGRSVLAAAYLGQIAIWEIPGIGPASETTLRDWSGSEVIRAVDRSKASATIRRDEQGKLSVEVVELGRDKPAQVHTLFEEVVATPRRWDAKLEFQRIRQYREDGRPLDEGKAGGEGFGSGDGGSGEGGSRGPGFGRSAPATQPVATQPIVTPANPGAGTRRAVPPPPRPSPPPPPPPSIYRH
jgi:hypothetical protein